MFYHIFLAKLFIWMLLKTVFRAHSQERDSGETAVDVEAARLVAQKLGENGIGGQYSHSDSDSHIFVAQKLGENGIEGDFYVILSR